MPTFIISPYVKPGVVHSGKADATSILALLAERLTQNVAYSQAVAERQAHFDPLSPVLDNAPVTDAPKPIPQSVIDALVYTDPTDVFNIGEPNDTALGFMEVNAKLTKLHPEYFAQMISTAMIS